MTEKTKSRGAVKYELATPYSAVQHTEDMEGQYQKRVTFAWKHKQIKDYSGLPGRITVMLIGNCGVGKSATGNTIVGEPVFASNSGSTQVTHFVERQTTRENNILIDVLDTPAFFGTSYEASNRDVLLEIEPFAEVVHVFLAIYRIHSRFTKEETAFVQTIENHFGEEIWKHCLLVLTHAGAFDAHQDKTLHEDLINRPRWCSLYEKVDNKAIAIENRTSKEPITDRLKDRELLIHSIVDLVSCNEGKLFSSSAFEGKKQKEKQTRWFENLPRAYGETEKLERCKRALYQAKLEIQVLNRDIYNTAVQSTKIETLQDELQRYKHICTTKENEYLILKHNQNKAEEKNQALQKQVELFRHQNEMLEKNTCSATEYNNVLERLKVTKEALEKTQIERNKIENELKQSHMDLQKRLQDASLRKEQTTSQLKEKYERERSESAKKIEEVTQESKELKLELNRMKMKLGSLTKETEKTSVESERRVLQLTTELEHYKHVAEKAESDKKDFQSKSFQIIKGHEVSLKQYQGKVDELEKEIRCSANTCELLQMELQKTKHALEQMQTAKGRLEMELGENKLKLAMEERALKEVRAQTQQTITELQQRATVGFPYSEGRNVPEISTLAADFGRLVVSIAHNLTLDHSLQLATLFQLTRSDHDRLRRLSMYESPGIRCLEEMKKYNIFNMYDVTNLQRAFEIINLEKINNELVIPYQNNIDKASYEKHKTKEMFVCKDTQKGSDIERKPLAESPRNEIPSSTSDGLNDNESRGATDSSDVSGRNVSQQVGKGRLISYVEQKIGKEGGEITLSGASLTVPPYALQEDCVLGLTFDSSPDVDLPGEIQRHIITPLIKLEPLGLELEKPARLIVTHSAQINETDRQKFNAFSGLTGGNENITWTDEASMTKNVAQKWVELEVARFTYISMTLQSDTQIHNKRLVLFVDGLQKGDDDILLTLGFCGDSEEEYQELLLENQLKLSLEACSTITLLRDTKSSSEADSILIGVSSMNGSYLCSEEETKKIPVEDVCVARRMTKHFRVDKNKSVNSDIVDLRVTVSQNASILADISLKTNVQNLLVSELSRKILLDDNDSDDFGPYEEMKNTISSKLEKLHCIKLAKYFNLSEPERELILSSQNSGTVLLEILEKKGDIHPRKMINLYQSLNHMQLSEVSQQVAEYIASSSKQDSIQQIISLEIEEKLPKSAPWLKIQLSKELLEYVVNMSIYNLMQTLTGVWKMPYQSYYWK